MFRTENPRYDWSNGPAGIMGVPMHVCHLKWMPRYACQCGYERRLGAASDSESDRAGWLGWDTQVRASHAQSAPDSIGDSSAPPPWRLSGGRGEVPGAPGWLKVLLYDSACNGYADHSRLKRPGKVCTKVPTACLQTEVCGG